MGAPMPSNRRSLIMVLTLGSPAITIKTAQLKEERGGEWAVAVGRGTIVTPERGRGQRAGSSR